MNYILHTRGTNLPSSEGRVVYLVRPAPWKADDSFRVAVPYLREIISYWKALGFRIRKLQ
jgi:hypothetical protein